MAQNTSDNAPQWPGTAVTQWPGQRLDASQEKSELNLLDVPGEAFKNLIPSAKAAGESLIQPIVHPIETAKGLSRLGAGVAQKLSRTRVDPATGNITFDRGAPGQYEPYADAAGQFLANRYGGWANIKNTMATDPVGFVADLATVVPGGQEALVRAPGALAKFGGKAATETIGVVTGKGGEAYRGLAKVGFEGGPAAQAATQNLRAPEQFAPEIVSKARSALADMFLERSAEYQKFQTKFGKQTTPLSFNDIDAAIQKGVDVGRFRGLDVAKLAGEKDLTAAQQMLTEIAGNVNAWKSLPPEFRTGPGLDALKQHIGSKIDWKTRPDAVNKVAQDVYHAIRDTIAKQDRQYAKAMKNYQQATDMLQQIEKTLSLGKKASEDTALRKLLSTTRSDVNTNFGRRLSMAEELNRRDPSILPSLYGQAAAPLAPGGLARGAAGLGGLAALYEHGLSPKLLATLAATSPRLWGEAALAAGKGARKAADLVPQQIIDAARAAGPYKDLIAKLGLAARAAGGASAAQ